MPPADGPEGSGNLKGLVPDYKSSTAWLQPVPSKSHGPYNIPHRQSAPSIFRGAWRRRSSAQPEVGDATALQGRFSVKGPLGLTTLHEPSETRVDFIFVHGLYGGSRKTWNIKPEDPATFWPQEWLPYESGFKHVRIHAFGYDSDWSKTQHSVLRVRDFAQSLISHIANSPVLKKSRDTPIVFVAHSMGGLVIKQAFLLAKLQEAYHHVATRIHTMYFLGTPHRGSSAAVYLKAYLAISIPTGAKAYVKELLPDSDTAMDINDNFRHACKDVQLWSFFEGVPTAGIMIVEKASAVMDLPGERVEYLPADHRHLCKFSSMLDPCYMVLRDRFKTTIEQVDKDYALRRTAEMKAIAKALAITNQPESDLLRIQDQCHPGTCEWLTEDPGFQRWLGLEGDHDSCPGTPEIGPLDTKPRSRVQGQPPPRFLWLNGPPGSGKSVVSGQVVKYLNLYNLDCNYFFFKNDTKATITSLLLGLAYQMAEVSLEARQMFLALIENGDEINTKDHTVIWNSLFLGRLFKVNFSQPLYWVIDALDECPKKSLTSLIQKFAKINGTIPLRIFLTSRPDSPDAPVEQLLDEEKIRRVELHTGLDSSMRDIERFVKSRPRLSRLINEGENGKVMATILDKSRGIFLWAALTVARLDELYSAEDIEAALEEVPTQMHEFYANILETIKNSPNADKAECILKWVVCAPSPMTVEELKDAVLLDIGHTLLGSSSGDMFSEMCGSLVACGPDQCVRWMHQTVKEFLTSGQSGFYIDYRKAHQRIADICLQYLQGKKFVRHSSRRPKVQGRRGATAATPVFSEYASTHFSYHLRHSQSTAPGLLSTIAAFASSKSLVWMEQVARRGNLAVFISTIQSLKPYLVRYFDNNPPFDANYQLVSTWVNDITRIITIFGPVIIECPESVYAFVPGLCPTSSIIYQVFAKGAGLKVICNSNTSWDKRLSCLSCHAAAKAVAAKDQFFAVGLADGTIRIFDNSTLQESAVLSHRAPLRHLAFGNVSNILASCSPQKLVLWDPDHKQRWSVKIPGIASSVSFNTDDSKIFVTLKKNFNQEILAFRTADGATLDPLRIRFREDGSESDTSSSDGRNRSVERYCPEVIRFSPALGYAAVTFRASHLTIFSLDENDNLEKLCCLQKEGTEELRLAPDIHDAVFNPAVESEFLAVAYQDGDVVVFEMDEWNPQQVCAYSIHAYVLASSPDGRTLAAGDTMGGVSLFAFETLQLLHRIEPLEEVATGMIFSSNSLRLYDVRGRSCNIWEPSVLFRKNFTDDNSTDPEDPEPTIAEPEESVHQAFDDSKTITVIAPAVEDKLVFCGRDDGFISVHEIKTGKEVFELKLHSTSIQHIEWNGSARLLVTADTSSRCRATRLSSFRVQTPPLRSCATETIFNRRSPLAISQVIVRPDGHAVLLSSENGEELCEADQVTQSTHSIGAARWVQHPVDRTRLCLFQGHKVRIFGWNRLSVAEGLPEAGISLVGIHDSEELPLRNLWFSTAEARMLVQASPLPQAPSSANMLAFLTLDSDTLGPTSTEVRVKCAVLPQISSLGGVKAIIGLTRSTVLFLTRSGWICSLSLKSFPDLKSYTRHLYIPPFWRAGGDFLVKVVAKDTLAIANRDDLVIVHGFLNFEHKFQFEDCLE
ncbi:hypothetical protein QBC37DRAFT_11651 [Rhypophila decipiens]|uniref:GPI inositol-deacylase n=1 Tax=Rhypophila decipiens TaxID=261697 RepID=A0AAN7B604_9PEZI|nr:hypothetical protein QBC37DRAFT_11651 [Rhypophila decipiens]